MAVQVRRAAPNELRVDFVGQVEQADVESIDAGIRSNLVELPPKSFNVVLNLKGATDFSAAAREAMVAAHKKIAEVANRIAYVDDRATFRGLGLWVAHLAQDANAKAVAQLEQARAWFVGSDNRVIVAQKLAGVLK
ncbi:MAG: hypothetical protein JST54_32305 [Deltaproteobacteria bacterium]|nr:hypothetical protein [Deltaproteobacteria bacterium]